MSEKKEEKPKLEKPHRFAETHFSTPTWCTVCKKFIWGITSKQGYECSGCTYRIHHRCKEAAEKTNCDTRKANTGIKDHWEGELIVKEITGTEHHFHVSSTLTIGEFKEGIAEKIGSKPEKLTLLKYAQHIEKDNKKTLLECNLSRGMVIQVLED
eukprot:TRINITY_DN31913_c0_g1_i1.p1 TRINITY_DN31913_c0_g1~~TRINITY_DN31913_c0_g1_i1.p1  ORF type:complete len:155 (+),score=15.46 TRINITY_DN31913_c0_g1_i1:52-516(+)